MVVRIVSTVSFMDNRESILGCRSWRLSTVSFQERRRSSFSFTSDSCAKNAEGSARDDYRSLQVFLRPPQAKRMLHSVERE
ncbi:hypothetical protein HPB47_023343 [Ixodes persulcatus]|uniref:Uncharacterized protein n=1 Tax=Ixodes persulcatus TaxID=34615 RepID=A0AC60Q9P4_IXOPE|nr:hypothetical protein HPB47_023343 [Ixodes persulcatus]